VVSIANPYAKEVYIRCAPTLDVADGLDFRQQTQRFYRCLPRLLAEVGAAMENVVLERAFFENFTEDMDDFQRIRAEAYVEAGIPETMLPATTYIQQPPARKAEKIEMQIVALVPAAPNSTSVKTFLAPGEMTTAKLVEMGGYKHLFISNINGLPVHGDAPASFREQSDVMFAKAARLLQRHGIRFPKVLRTWCYIYDIDENYAEFNLSRNAFFEEEGVKRLPASTGIEATLYPEQALCAMDLYAVLNPEGVGVEVMHTPTLNEADDYGSAFSRGMKVDLPEKTVLYISGTASVDEHGDTVHVGDVRKQMERMLVNVRELLAPHGATFEDMVQMATFLKYADYLETFQDALKEWGIDHIPNTLVEAGVCRPDLLCELEGIAVLPKSGPSGNGESPDAEPSRQVPMPQPKLASQKKRARA